MSYFDPAWEFVKVNEGGYSDHPADSGGPTRHGVSSRFHPDVNIANLSEGDAKELAHDRYWTRWNLPLLTDKNIAIKVFDLIYWMGPHRGTKALQRALRALGHPVAEDGMLGPETAGAANAMDERILLPAIRAEAGGMVRALVARKPSQDVFKVGWLNRAYR